MFLGLTYYVYNVSIKCSGKPSLLCMFKYVQMERRLKLPYYIQRAMRYLQMEITFGICAKEK